MALEPVYADRETANPSATPSELQSAVHVSPKQQQLIGVRTGRVETSSVTQNLRVLGRVALDESRVFPVSAGADGWVRQIYPVATGGTVQKGQPLLVVNGREYTAA
jgi:Cu(I)/Ag(I) efflux system membrane fusion protein